MSILDFTLLQTCLYLYLWWFSTHSLYMYMYIHVFIIISLVKLIWMYGIVACINLTSSMHGCLNVWACGCINLCWPSSMHGCLNVWACGYINMCMDVWMYGLVAVLICTINAWMYECMGLCLYEYVLSMHGCMNVWACGCINMCCQCMDVWMYGLVAG